MHNPNVCLDFKEFCFLLPSEAANVVLPPFSLHRGLWCSCQSWCDCDKLDNAVSVAWVMLFTLHQITERFKLFFIAHVICVTFLFYERLMKAKQDSTVMGLSWKSVLFKETRRSCCERLWTSFTVKSSFFECSLFRGHDSKSLVLILKY